MKNKNEQKTKAQEVLSAIIAYFNTSARQLAIDTRLPESRFYDIQSGKTKTVSPEVCKALLTIYPSLSREWIRSGQGDMITSVSIRQQGDPTPYERIIELIGNQANFIAEQTKELKALRREVASLTELIKQNDKNYYPGIAAEATPDRVK